MMEADKMGVEVSRQFFGMSTLQYFVESNIVGNVGLEEELKEFHEVLSSRAQRLEVCVSKPLILVAEGVELENG